MKGNWNGNYKYDKKEIQKIIGFEQTNFKIIINEFDNINFVGKVIDDQNTGGMKGEGEIIGKVENGIINFIKQMPNNSLILNLDGDRKQTNKKHSPIYYTGKQVNPNKFIGTWKFKNRIGLLFGFLPIIFSPGKGQWEIEREQKHN